MKSLNWRMGIRTNHKSKDLFLQLFLSSCSVPKLWFTINIYSTFSSSFFLSPWLTLFLSLFSLKSGNLHKKLFRRVKISAGDFLLLVTYTKTFFFFSQHHSSSLIQILLQQNVVSLSLHSRCLWSVFAKVNYWRRKQFWPILYM